MNLTAAINGSEWELAALRLLAGVAEAARTLPPGGSRHLLALLEGEERRGRPA